MIRRPRAIVVGPGFIGSVHADVLRRNGVGVVAFVGSGSVGVRQRAEDVLGSYVPSLAEALAAEEVDCEHTATPNHLHALLAKNAMAPGKHDVCEKPLALNAAEGYVETHRGPYRAVHAAVAAGGPAAEPDSPMFADGLRSLRLGDAIGASSREWRWVMPDLAMTP